MTDGYVTDILIMGDGIDGVGIARDVAGRCTRGLHGRG
jgi:glycerol-3-phosphate dehydrogenase